MYLASKLKLPFFPSKNNSEKVLQEAKDRLNKVCLTSFKSIARELAGLDQYQYLKAFAPGLQEFIESYTYYEYCSSASNPENGEQMCSWEDLQKKLTYESEDGQKTYVLVEPMEFILGVGDLTGELMRKCINSLGSGDISSSFNIANSLKSFYTCYKGLNVHNRELGRKLQTLRNSLLKTDNVSYNIKIRSEEAVKLGKTFDPREVLEEINAPKDEHVDEGFYH